MILAAGAGSRLGTCKALVDLTPTAERSLTPLQRLLSAGLGLDPLERLVVTGAEHAAISAATPAEVLVVHNAAWSAGRTGGVLLARRALPGLDLCLAPVDVPLVSRKVFEQLRRAWDAAGAPPRGWLAPAYSAAAGDRKRYGHPVLVGRDLLDCLTDKDCALPLRNLRAHADPLLSVDVSDPAILDDLDTPQDLEDLRSRCNPD